MGSVTATPSGSSLIVSWQPVSGATAYDVFLSESPGVSPTSYTEEVVSTTSSATISGLTIGATYYLVVAPTAVSGFSLGPASDVVSVEMTGASATPVPVITAISVSPQVVSSGSSVLFAASATDTDGDTLDYTWTVNGSTVAGPTADLDQYTWIAPGTTGSYTVGVTVTDGTTTASATTTVTVD